MRFVRELRRVQRRKLCQAACDSIKRLQKYMHPRRELSGSGS